MRFTIDGRRIDARPPIAVVHQDDEVVTIEESGGLPVV